MASAVVAYLLQAPGIEMDRVVDQEIGHGIGGFATEGVFYRHPQFEVDLDQEDHEGEVAVYRHQMSEDASQTSSHHRQFLDDFQEVFDHSKAVVSCLQVEAAFCRHSKAAASYRHSASYHHPMVVVSSHPSTVVVSSRHRLASCPRGTMEILHRQVWMSFSMSQGPLGMT